MNTVVLELLMRIYKARSSMLYLIIYFFIDKFTVKRLTDDVLID